MSRLLFQPQTGLQVALLRAQEIRRPAPYLFVLLCSYQYKLYNLHLLCYRTNEHLIQKQGVLLQVSSSDRIQGLFPEAVLSNTILPSYPLTLDSARRGWNFVISQVISFEYEDLIWLDDLTFFGCLAS